MQWTPWVLGEKRALREASHRGHGGHRGGMGLIVETLFVETVTPLRETRDKRK